MAPQTAYLIMSTVTSDHSLDKQEARPRYFVIRPDTKRRTDDGVKLEPGAIVPLIAVDQLPDWLEVIGVPRDLYVSYIPKRRASR